MFIEFAQVLALAAVIGLLAVRLKQPTIVAFIVTGILVGPAVLDWVHQHDAVEGLAQLGVTVLLFLVGLKLDPALVRSLGAVALATGLGQLGFTIAFGFAIALALGMDSVRAIYVAVALTFSSTIIIIKLLSDKRELDSLHGRIATGFLIVQDIAVVLAMTVIGALGVAGAPGAGDGAWPVLALQGIGAAFGIVVLVRYGMRWILPWMASAPDLMVIVSVAWGVALAALGEHFGLSREVGAFLAGFALAGTPFREAVGARLAGLRDFLLLFFFVHLGTQLQFADLGSQLPAATVFALFVLVGNPLIVMAIMGFMGYRRRTGFLAGLTVAQISEFSVIFVAMGVTLGHVEASALSLITLVGLVTIAASSYMITYSHHLFAWIGPWLGPFERRDPWRERIAEDDDGQPGPVVLVFGVGRYGARLMHRLTDLGVDVLGVDFDPESVREGARAGLHVRFGDAEDAEFGHSLPLAGARIAVATMADPETVRHLRLALAQAGFDGELVAAARMPGAAEALRRIPVDLVLDPFDDAADQAAVILSRRLPPELRHEPQAD